MENEFKRVQQYKNYLYKNNIQNNRYSSPSKYNHFTTQSTLNKLYHSSHIPLLTEPNNDYSSGDYSYHNRKPVLAQGILRSNYSDITNPDYYSKHTNDYYNYKRRANELLFQTNAEEEKNKRLKDFFEFKRNDNIFLNVKYLDYLQGKKKIGEINPYNLHNPSLGESMLAHNTILNPVCNYTHNKYILRPFKKAGESILKYA